MLNKNRGPISIILSVVISVLFVVAAVEAATTISSNISTGGTLTVTGTSSFTGLSTFLGGATTTTLTLLNGEVISNATDGVIQLGGVASTTSITLLNGETITNATDGTIALTGALTVSGASSFTGLSTFLGGATTTSITLLNGETITNATDGVVEIVGTASSTSLIVGGNSTNGTIAGVVFGTCTYDGASITASTTLSTNCTGATGVRTADRVFITPRSLENGLIFTSASSTANDVIQVSVYNTGRGGIGGTIDPASATWDWMAIR